MKAKPIGWRYLFTLFVSIILQATMSAGHFLFGANSDDKVVVGYDASGNIIMTNVHTENGVTRADTQASYSDGTQSASYQAVSSPIPSGSSSGSSSGSGSGSH